MQSGEDHLDFGWWRLQKGMAVMLGRNGGVGVIRAEAWRGQGSDTGFVWGAVSKLV